jgi:hypothetical protein
MKRISHSGEILKRGVEDATTTATSESHAVYNLREDLLAGFHHVMITVKKEFIP